MPCACPLCADNPIVFVTKPWEEMCGFTYAQAVGRNPRVTQGERSDPKSISAMSSALQAQRSCKVMMLNYRGGLNERPFWNMLSISPIIHQGRLQFYLANLQDYSYHMAKLIRTPPSQFCRSAEHHQRLSRLPVTEAPLSLRYYARPAVFEMHGPTAAQAIQSATEPTGGHGAHLQLKRLGWANLSLEPEYLADRVCDALQQLDARYERATTDTSGDDVFVVNADLHGVACRILVTTEPGSDCFRISCSRLAGDTFAYHDAFRQLRDLLGDAVQGATPLHPGRGGIMGAGSSLGRGGGMVRPALTHLGLAPMPTLERGGANCFSQPLTGTASTHPKPSEGGGGSSSGGGGSSFGGPPDPFGRPS